MAHINILPYIDRFNAKVNRTPTCHLWMGTINRDGYGMFPIRLEDGTRKSVLAHRWLWINERGEIPYEMHLDHLCRNPSCVNLEHLEVVTPAENNRRARIAKAGRGKLYCKNGHRMDDSNAFYYPERPTHRRCRKCIEIWKSKSVAIRAIRGRRVAKFSRKQYTLIAQVMLDTQAKGEAFEEIATRLADLFERDNFAFSREHFMAVIRGERPVGSSPRRANAHNLET